MKGSESKAEDAEVPEDHRQQRTLREDLTRLLPYKSAVNYIDRCCIVLLFKRKYSQANNFLRRPRIGVYVLRRCIEWC
jgi:hypothetical protein